MTRIIAAENSAVSACPYHRAVAGGTASSTAPSRAPEDLKRVPGPRGYPFVGVLPMLARDPLGFLAATSRQYGDIVRIDVGRDILLLLSHPDHVRRVLLDNCANYPRSRFNARLRPLVGDGLVTSEGEDWWHQRGLLQPIFTRARLDSLCPLIAGAAENAVQRWRGLARSGQVIDVEDEMARLSLHAFCSAMFGVDVSNAAAEICDLCNVLLGMSLPRLWASLPVLECLPTRRNRRVRTALARRDEIVSSLIAQRRSLATAGDDLLSTLIAAYDAGARDAHADRRLRDQVITLMFAGLETTAVALSWFWYLMALNPDAERRLHEEIDAGAGDGFGQATTLDRLSFTGMALNETMRLYPPVWAFSRTALAEDRLGSLRIPAGTTVLLSQFLVHRDARFWEEPNRFDPDRFTSARSRGRHSQAYFPFGRGPHTCIGRHLAMMEMQIIVASLAKHFRVELACDTAIDPSGLLSLRAAGGIPARIVERGRGHTADAETVRVHFFDRDREAVERNLQ